MALAETAKCSEQVRVRFGVRLGPGSTGMKAVFSFDHLRRCATLTPVKAHAARHGQEEGARLQAARRRRQAIAACRVPTAAMGSR
jgi:hypothetical protein